MSSLTVQDQTPEIEVIDRKPTVTLASSGPAGPPGAAGDIQNQTRTYVAASAVGGGRIVRSSTVTDVEHADSSDAGNMHNTIGLTLAAASGGGNVQVLIEGQSVDVSWAWTVGDPIFFNTSGVLTQTAPATGFYQAVGHALTATSVLIRIHAPIRR